MKNEPTPKSNSDAEELSPAAREFSRVIAAALIKFWQKEHQTQENQCGEFSHPSCPLHHQ